MSSATPSGEPEDSLPLGKFPWQVHFEALYLAIVAIAGVLAILAIRYGWISTLDGRTKTFLYAALGGLLGGWCFDAKWFYRAVAHTGVGTTIDDWKSNRFYWRVFTPFMASFVSFAVYLAGVSEVLFVKISNESGALAFSFCFILGHFSEVVQSKLANAIEHLLPGASGDVH